MRARGSSTRLAGAFLAAVLGLTAGVGLAGPVLADPPIPGGHHEDESHDGGSRTPGNGSDSATDPASAPLEVPDVAVDIGRLGGSTRYATAALISEGAFPDGAETVYLARGDVFADAIAAGALTDGPVLLVRSCGTLPAVVATEIARVNPEEVVALGGTASICEPMLTTAAAGRPTDRLAGVNRFDTAAQIAVRAFPEGADTVYLAEHRESADAVAGGSLTDGPILLVANGSDAVPSQTATAIAALNPTNVVALGGSSVVTELALTTAADGRHTERVSGADRYATSAAIAARAFPDGSSRTYLASGRSIADAVVGGTLTDGPILLVPSACRVVSQSVWRRLSTHPPTEVVALGGKAAVCTEQLHTGARLATFSGMETGDTERLYDLLTKPIAVSPLKYVPPDLVNWRGTSYRLRPEVTVMLEEMFDDATAAGRPGLYVNSAYRSYAEQQATYDYWVRMLGEEQASMISAKAGHSEHQLGLAVDLGGPSCTGYACFGDTPEGKWVAANAHKYGFIIRYPEGGTDVTGYYYEPWHLRYVGPRAAWMMHVRDRIFWDTYQPVAVADAQF